jgi:two-component system phosphate regulon response regulator PhoB
MKPRILVVEDEPDAIELISFKLKESGFDVIKALDGAEALKSARTAAPDLILLDLMIPEVDGLEVCKILRRDAKTSGIPIIMVTAKASEIDRVLGLEYGADDYVTKPFSPRELVLRVRKLLKRRDKEETDADRFQIGTLFIDLTKHFVSVDGHDVELTVTEFKLLSLFARRQGRVLSRDQLLQDVWEYNSSVDTRTVDTHVRRLREKLGSAAVHLNTIRGVGYRFDFSG